METGGVKHLLAAMEAPPLAMTATSIDERTTQAEFEVFYLRTARTLHGYLCRLSRDPATADEVLQEAYVRMLNAPALEEAHRKAYLYATATNILRDRWRKEKREREWSELSGISERMHQNHNLPLDMAAIFDRLSPQERAVLWLAHVEELSHREIGAILGVKEKSVRVMVFRAREKAKELLEKAGFQGPHE
jgi:RNA polymerase sigma-70 factor, ECF subfamily